MESDVVTIFTVSFITSFIMMEIVSPKICSRIGTYQSLTPNQKLEWNSRVLSSIHAAIATFRALYVMCFNNYTNYVLADDKFAFNTISLTTGYITADLCMLIIYRERIGGTIGIAIHHITTIQAYSLCLSKQYLVYFANYKLLAEASTVFLNIRWALVACDKKDSQLYFYNGLALTTSFFLSRILLVPFFYQRVLETIYTSIYIEAVSTAEHYSWVSVSITLDVLNVMWFHKLVRGILRYLGPGQKKKKETIGHCKRNMVDGINKCTDTEVLPSVRHR